MIAVAELAAVQALARVSPGWAATLGMTLGLAWIILYVPSRPLAGANLDEWLALGWLTLLLAGLSVPAAAGRTGRCTSFPPGALYEVDARTPAADPNPRSNPSASPGWPSP